MEGQAPPPYPTQQQPQPGAYYPPPQPGSYPPPQPGAYPPPAGYPGQQPMYPPAPGQPGQPYYPPPQTGQQQQSTTVIMTQAILAPASYGFNPVQTTCPHCQATVQTAVEYEVGGYAWMICGIITLVAFVFFPPLILGCCFIPFCINDCKDVVHICPNCRQTLAHVPRR